MSNASPTPPRAAKQQHTITQLGRARTDDYAWMKDEDWQKVLRDPSVLRADIREHLLAENAFTAAILAGTESLQAELLAEMKGRIKRDDSSVPAKDGVFAYYRRYELGAEHPVFARLNSDGAEEVLLDADAASKGHGYYKVVATEHSRDHALFAYAEDTQGSEVYRIFVKDLKTGVLLGEPVESTTGSFAFSPCSNYLFWTFRDANGRPTKIFRRPVAGGDDVLVYEELDEGFFIGVDGSASGGSVFINCGNQDTSEVWRIPGDDPLARPVVIQPRETGIKYDVEDAGAKMFIRTNADGAVDFKIVEAPTETPGRAHWHDYLPHRPGHYVIRHSAAATFVARVERVEANNRIVVTPFGGEEFAIAVDEPAYALMLEPGYEYDTTTIRYVYSSPTTPRQTFDYDVTTRARVLRKTQDVPSGHDPALYETRRLTATAADGTAIPVTVLMRRGTKLDGTAPVHLYGYGAYGISIEPGFGTNILSLVDRGWIHVVAHIRGGTEKGWDWFLGGRGPTKMNSFTDFIAVAEHLIKAGYTGPGKIVAHGGSAGGLLMGAVLNLRPDLWGGVIAAVPFVDVLNTMSDTTLPLTPPEWPEWGNPLVDAEAYETIAAYSPYDNIAAKNYPPLLMTGGLSDPRVTYWEPAKFIAKLREHSTSGAPALLKINMEAGHGGSAGRFDALKETALDYAFAIWAVPTKTP
jgi:oligopeptidase B